MQEDLENKSVTLIINSSKLTGRTLTTAFMKLLQYSRNRLREHREEQQDPGLCKDPVLREQDVVHVEVLHRKSGKYEHRQGHPRPPVAGHDETGRCHQQRSIQNRTGTAFEGYEPSCYCSVSSRNWSDQRWLRLSKQMNWPENFR